MSYVMAPNTDGGMGGGFSEKVEDSSSGLKVVSESVTADSLYMFSKYSYQTVKATVVKGQTIATPSSIDYHFRTETKVPKTGVMLVGLGGNNGTTVTAAAIANRLNINWHDKDGVQAPNWYGSITQASTTCIGFDSNGKEVWMPLNSLLPMISPNDLVIGGWDINNMNLASALERAKVLPYDLQRQLRPHMEGIVPLPSIFKPHFVAKNQVERANNILEGTDSELLKKVRSDIREFKASNSLDCVLVLWTANTERFAELKEGLNDTKENLLASIKNNESEVSPSTLFAVAAIQEGCPFINGSPQNTLVPGIVDLAMEKAVPICGDDFKSGQTKFKSALTDFLISAGIKPMSITSYNHLGNNDGLNLSEPAQFRSKEISKSDVVLDMVSSNKILYPNSEKPDHVVVIKYVPHVGDSKRAMDEYVSEILLHGKNTIVVHNTCEDSLLAAPLIVDLIVLMELMTRINYKTVLDSEYGQFHPVISLLSYLLKAPKVQPGAPIINSLFRQRACIVNVLRACAGLPPDNHMMLEHMAAPGCAFVPEVKTCCACQHSKKIGEEPCQSKTPLQEPRSVVSGGVSNEPNLCQCVDPLSM